MAFYALHVNRCGHNNSDECYSGTASNFKVRVRTLQLISYNSRLKFVGALIKAKQDLLLFPVAQGRPEE